jgi:hypothetical protein
VLVDNNRKLWKSNDSPKSALMKLQYLTSILYRAAEGEAAVSTFGSAEEKEE